jgi:hypothetical protein
MFLHASLSLCPIYNRGIFAAQINVANPDTQAYLHASTHP